MDRYYIRYSAPNRSYSVIDRNRRNDFGDPYVVIPLVTEIEARRACTRLNDADTTAQSIRTYYSNKLGSVTIPE